ncbi:RNA polymerase sigma factor SigJ [Nocardia goodfellowii]|uniref:RNA polymerase sigma-70 factor (ECF subfamily) n=1 Tax=Nocardia goodfellowii TaxID=882446 RepID=A0ABS4QE80_9NOCA|nr:RNA polymerase sigma factor SigJ [Nocardia goodfellowii]MBP2190012.1 RNA polymerase sigma-70 factor (ECF subfamily) [Nocardia goodfellowii]
MSDSVGDEATRIFAEHRELLFSIVYNLLGTVADTEDVLQDTWLAWVPRNRPGAAAITSPRAYLVRIAVNNALARRAVLARRRETYVGPWLPEPLVSDTPEVRDSADPADPALRAESVSMAMLVVLETLSPLERAVFVLHDVFGYPHAEIGEILGRETTAIRQLAHRARAHVHARRPRYQADPRTQRAVTERFLAAQVGGDVNALLELLAPDVTFWSDGGGKSRAALRPIQGADKIARLITSPVVTGVPELGIEHRWVGGDPSAVILSGRSLFAVVVLDIDPDTEKVRGIYAVRNPEKLTHIDA